MILFLFFSRKGDSTVLEKFDLRCRFNSRQSATVSLHAHILPEPILQVTDVAIDLQSLLYFWATS